MFDFAVGPTWVEASDLVLLTYLFILFTYYYYFFQQVHVNQQVHYWGKSTLAVGR